MEAIPLLIGVIGSLDDARAAVRDLGEQYQHMPLLFQPAEDDRMRYGCDLLVVVMPGELSSELAAIVDRRLSGATSGIGPGRLLSAPDAGPCFVSGDAAVRRLFPREEAEFAEELARRDRFNADLGAVPAPPAADALQRLHLRTDAASNRLQRIAQAWQGVLYAIAFVAASVQVVTVIPHGAYVKFAAVALAFIVYFFVQRKDYQNRYQDYRAIGEALRVQAIWSANGIVESVADSYLPMQQTDLQWIRDTLRTLAVLNPVNPAAFDRDAVAGWVHGQRRYFARRSQIEARRRNAFARGAAGFGVVSLIASLAALLMSVAHRGTATALLAVGIAATWTALCVALARSYARARSYSENANRYQRMFFVFDRASALLAAAGEPEQVRAIAAELGCDALTEHAEWLLAQRERRIAIVSTAV